MGCCANAGGGNVVIRLLLALLVVCVTGPLALLSWLLSFVPGMRVLHRFFFGLFTSFSEGLREDLKKPLISGSLHCKLSGRLLHHSPRLSGLVYNHFNLFLLLPLLLIIVLVWYVV